MRYLSNGCLSELWIELMLALAAICFGSVYAHGTPATVKNITAQQDTTKKKEKMKDDKKKTKTKTKTGTTATPKPSM